MAKNINNKTWVLDIYNGRRYSDNRDPEGLSWPIHSPEYQSVYPGVAGYGLETTAGSGRNLETPATTVIFVNSLATGNTGTAVTGLGPNVFAGTWEYAWRRTASPKVIIPLVSGWVPVRGAIPNQTGTPPRPGFTSFYGQFAPKQGLFIRGNNLGLNGGSNIAVWHLRSYMGDDEAGLSASARDCLSSGYADGLTSNIALINCEFSWSVDELVDFYRAHHNVSFVGCAFIDPLHISQLQPGDPPGTDHGFGPIIGGDAFAQASNVSTFRNLWAHVTDRNPLTNASSLAHANNLHYNHGRPTPGAGAGVNIVNQNSTSPSSVNLLGNAFIRGPNNNSSLVAARAATNLLTGSAGYSAANAQFGWTPLTDQSQFFTVKPTDFDSSTIVTAALPSGWNSLDGILEWAEDPLNPTEAEWNDYIDLMEKTVGAQPAWRTANHGGVQKVFGQIRDRLEGGSLTNQFINTVDEAGGWFAVDEVLIDPLNPGEHWHAPFPTGSDRDTPYPPGSGTFSNGVPREGYTRLEAWAFEQHLFTMSSQQEPVSPPIGDQNMDFTTQSVTASPAILDLRQDYSISPKNNVIWLSGSERLATYEYIPDGGFYGQGCAKFVPGQLTDDPIGNPRGDHYAGIGEIYGFGSINANERVTVGVLWCFGPDLIEQSNGMKCIILQRGGGQSTRPMIIPQGDFSGSGTVVLPACDGTVCNTRDEIYPPEEENYWNTPATGEPNIKRMYGQWVWTEISVDLTADPSMITTRSWFEDGSELGTSIIRKPMYEGSGGTIPGINIINYVNSVTTPLPGCYTLIERVEIHANTLGPVTPPIGFPGSARS